MGFKRDIFPILRSMQFAGLLPTGRLVIGGYCPDEHSQNQRPPVLLKHLIYPLILVIIEWIIAFRMLTVFFVAPKRLVGEVAYDVMFVSIYFFTAFMRTSFLLAHWNGNKWLKMLDHFADGDCEEDELTPRKGPPHPLAVLIPNDDQQREVVKKRAKQLRKMNLVFWCFVAGNITFLLTIFVIRREAFDTLTQPFSYVCRNADDCYYPSLVVVVTFIFVSDLTIFCNGLITTLTFELAHRFHDLHRWIDSHRKQYVNAVVAAKNRRKYGHQDDSVPTVGVQNLNAYDQVKGTFELEPMLRAHLNLLIGVRKLDKVARVTIASSMSFGFVGILVNMYQIGWGTQDNLMRTIWGYWTCCCLNFLFSHIIASSSLNARTIEVQESLFRLPSPAFAVPDDGDERPATLKLSLLLGQFGTEPIALTYLGMFFLRTDGIMNLTGGLMAYFLLLVEISAGEKRGFTEGLKAKCDAVSNITNATKT